MGITWHELLNQSICDVTGIQKYLSLNETETEKMKQIISRYPIRVNPYYLSLVNKEDANDPIKKMCIPDLYESSAGGQTDTSGESENTVFQGMQHKYKQTVLILSTSQCAMYCRHCFRKRMVGACSDEVARQLPVMADYVRTHPEVNNVLISGGDAFMNSNETIEQYLQYFTEIANIEFIRFGTRIPVVLPQRIIEDEELLGILKKYGEKKQIIIVTQYNHPRELTPESTKAIQMLRDVGCLIRNQTVLLKGVNDNANTIAQLMNRLVSQGVIPYYIFQCRPVEGVKNQFQVPLLKGVEIVENARKQMSGQAKSVRFALSHPTGKIEILGKKDGNTVLFKYHQAKNDADQSRIFEKKLDDSECWLQLV